MIPKWKDYAAWCALHGLDPNKPNGGNFHIEEQKDESIEELYLYRNRYILGNSTTAFFKDWDQGNLTQEDLEYGHNKRRWEKFFDS